MQPPWKLFVEDLGRIRQAEIEIRPLLLFVGGNNTGKTYLASLLWGLLSLTADLPMPRGAAYERCVAWIEERFARRESEPSFDLTADVRADLVEVLNDMLREHGTELAAKTFNRPGFDIGKIELKGIAPGGSSPQTEHSLRWERPSGDQPWSLQASGNLGRWGVMFDYAEHRAKAIGSLARMHVLGPFAGFTALFGPRGLLGYHAAPVFLPASRTGFMLLYRSVAPQLLGDALIKTTGGQPPLPDLTAPAIDFLKLLLGLVPESGAYPDEAAFLEGAIGGRFAVRSGIGLSEVLHEHAEGEPPLPMALSSALVSELAPVVLTLRHVDGYRMLFIEEPEAHLHPKLQRALAQVIVRLIRKGLHVCITTHSENFCQQINNFMKLGAHPRRAEMQQKYGYGAMDYLDQDDVAGYQFEEDADASGRSNVTELVKTPLGLVMPTFNRELAALTDEALDLEFDE